MDVNVANGFQEPLCRAATAAWPRADWPHWHFYDDGNSRKFATKDPARLTAACRRLVDEMAVLKCPEGTFPDLNLHGAGMHWVPGGGFLCRHRDGTRHPLTGWHRRWNSVLFLNECSGGELFIDGCVPIDPYPGRLVTFDSSAAHQVLPVTAGNRYSLSLFWWSLEGRNVSVTDTLSATFLKPDAARDTSS